MKISVVIPMYNAEKYIGDCLDSLLAQTFGDFEVIVVDDCSTDSSCAVVQSYAGKFGGRLKLARTEKNSGGGGYVPRNIGLNLSRTQTTSLPRTPWRFCTRRRKKLRPTSFTLPLAITSNATEN